MPRDADSFYVDDCRQVQSNTRTIQGITGQISRLVGTLESESDFDRCRKMVDDAVRQASETKVIVMRIREHQHQATTPAEKNNRRLTYQKLSDNLSITARVLEDVVRRFTAEENKHIGDMGIALGMSAADMAGGSQQPRSHDKPQMFDASAGDCQSQQFGKEELQREKCQAIRRVGEDMACLQKIYTDLASTADQQQSSFDSLESHMASASLDIERGREEISQSRYAWDRKQKRKAWMGGAAVGFICLVGWFGS